jgi:hypothetical protein
VGSTPYKDACLQGAYSLLNIGNYPNTNGLIPNDSLSSYYIGAGVTFEVFTNSNYGGTYDVINGNTINWADNQFSLPASGSLASQFGYNVGNDAASSFKVIPNCITPASGQCSFFTDAGDSNFCVTLNIGDYANSTGIGLPNDWISSALCGPNTYAALYQNDNFNSYMYTVGVNSGTDFALPAGVNDQTSSIIVY